MIVHRFALATTLAILFATAAGCGATNGGVCQIPSDCANGFFCCKNTHTPDARGVCRPNGTVEGMCALGVADVGMADASDSGSAPIDATADDAPDAWSDLDAATDDAATDDAATDDAATDMDAFVDVDAADVDAAIADAGAETGG